jgi:hypothetical protein
VVHECVDACQAKVPSLRVSVWWGLMTDGFVTVWCGVVVDSDR